MEFSLDDRICTLSVGEFASFTLGPRAAGQGGPSGVWRAQLGQHWHNQLRHQAEQEAAARTAEGTESSAAFEVPLGFNYQHGGWTFTFAGRVDQIISDRYVPEPIVSQPPAGPRALIREIKTISGPLPTDEATLRADYPEYFLQAVAYLTLLRTASEVAGRELAVESQLAVPSMLDLRRSVLRAELVFVEVGSGITQNVAIGAHDESLFQIQLERLAEFLDLRLRARERLRHLQFRPAFAALRPGQETIQEELLAAIGDVGSRSAEEGDRRQEAGNSTGTAPASSLFRIRSPVSGLQNPISDIRNRASQVLFEAPTGYGKTGVLLEFALGQLRAGRFARLLYLTGKSTGQLQVMRTLAAMTSADSSVSPLSSSTATPVAVAAWQVRPKAEHCVNSVFHCVRDACSFLADMELRWPQSGLDRFYLREDQPRDVDSLRTAGHEAHICPYEITRAALPFNDVWIGDYNYVFSPDSRGVFYERPGFNPAETLLIVDEAHNLPARVADAYSHTTRASEAEAVLAALYRSRPLASLLLAWEHWTRLLASLQHAERLDPAVEGEVRESIDRLAVLVATTALDYAALGPQVSGQLWQMLALRDWLAGEFRGTAANNSTLDPRFSTLPSLIWCPRSGELHFTCLDASAMIGETLRAFGGVILASATLQPADVFAAACGLDSSGLPEVRPEPAEPPATLGKLSRRARKTLKEVTTGAALLQVAEARETAQPGLLRAEAPWRDHAYQVGVDLRVDTTFQHRVRHYAATAATIDALHAAAQAFEGQTSTVDRPTATLATFGLRPSNSALAAFFPSYAYAESIIKALESSGSALRAALQPRSADLAAQAAWVEESLVQADVLFLVLGSSFAESIDLLGGRVTYAIVVGPALPEVNTIQRTRLAEFERAGLSRDAAFRRVYQVPGMQKVNQALGRLVRAPGQWARVLLHCRRFAESSYASLLAPEYQNGTVIAADEELAAWLQKPRAPGY